MQTFRTEIDKTAIPKVDALLNERDDSFHYFVDTQRSRVFLFLTVKDSKQLPETIKGWQQLITLD